MQPQVLLLCGLPGSGKTTFARSLRYSQNIQTYSSDEWIIKLFGRNFDSEKFNEYQETARQQILEQAANDLRQGKSVALDFGFWKKQDRAHYIEWAKSQQAEPIIYFFNADHATLVSRLNKRNEEKNSSSLLVTEDMLRAFCDQFELPTPDETKVVELK